MSTFYFASDPYFNPQLSLPSGDGAKAARIEAALAEVRFPIERSSALKAALAQELALGLEKSPSRPSAFPMFNTLATGAHFPTGSELGNFLAIDIGGTNLRVMVLKLTKEGGKTKQEIEVDFYEAPDEVRKSNSERFFGFLATSILDFVKKHNLINSSDPDYKVPLGFTFSFGYDQLAIDRGSVVQFGIETNIPDAIGRCPVELLQKSLDSIRAPIQVVALANDVTSTLIYAKYLQPEATVSLILGSGTNIGYIEQVAQFGRIADKPSKEVFGGSSEPVKELIINTELGFFGDRGEMDGWISRFEKQVDASSFLPSVYVFEKCAGAAFMGEHLRYVLLGLVEEKLLLNGRISKELASKSVMSAKDLSEIEEAYLKKDEDGGKGYKSVITKLLNRLGYQEAEVTADDIELVRLVVQLITVRVATFAAAEVAIFVDHLSSLPVVKIGVDGSLFRKHPKMATILRALIGQMCPGRAVELFDAEEGSSIGAALLAAVVVGKRK